MKINGKTATKRSALLALGICCAAMLIGCNDDDGGGDGDASLAGTTWVEVGSPSSTLTFYSDGTSFRIVDTADGTDATGSYTLTGNSFTFSASLTDDYGDTIGFSGTGTISGNSMTINVTIKVNGDFWASFTVPFTKQ
ncbi:hypothetical protein PDESU_00998 [Pontiella desulfatans]|uniref:Lipocalin-like domain-containing protein n=1 Tax=Pontiella desulfatans TaxID=2750659 RepID=A0A6C2TXS8_PONDE|nr:hypothetical protein [Pontiella desulfatans]VGO12445.1 hypothetical protein PDESU_00998 [Pontiella desulfatans]